MFKKNRETKTIMDPKKLVNKHFDILINNNKVKIIGYVLNNIHDIKNICLKTKIKRANIFKGNKCYYKN